MLEKFKYLKSLRNPWESYWEELAHYFHPGRVGLMSPETIIFEKSKNLYDTTGYFCNQVASQGIFGHMMSPALDWFKLKILGLEDDSIVAKWLQVVEGHLYEAFRRSNFYAEANVILLDGLSLGTGFFYMEENVADRTVFFKTMNPGTCWIGENQYGKVDTLFRSQMLYKNQAVEMFGPGHEKGIYIHCVEPEGGADGIYTSTWYDGNKVVRRGHYNHFPYAVWRNMKMSDEMYGRSLSMLAYPTMKVLNNLRKTMLQAAQLAIKPPVNAPAGAAVDLTPNGINWFSNPDEVIRPVNMGVNYSIGKDQEETLTQRVKDFFMIDLFMMISQQQQAMTATEVLQRAGEKAAVLCSVIGRITTEFLFPVIENVFAIELKAGRLPPVPEQIEDMELDIDFLGPLAVAQKVLFTSKGASQSLEAITPILQMVPETAQNFDWDILVRTTAQNLGFPATAIKDAEDVKTERKKQQLVQAAQMAAEADGEGGANPETAKRQQPGGQT